MAHHLPIANGFSKEQDERLCATGYPKEFFQIAGQSERIIYENYFSYLIPVNKHILPGFSGVPFLNSKGRGRGRLPFRQCQHGLCRKREHPEEFMSLLGRIGVSCENLDSHAQCLEKGGEKTIKDTTRKEKVAALAQFQLGRPEGYFTDIIPTKGSK